MNELTERERNRGSIQERTSEWWKNLDRFGWRGRTRTASSGNEQPNPFTVIDPYCSIENEDFVILVDSEDDSDDDDEDVLNGDFKVSLDEDEDVVLFGRWKKFRRRGFGGIEGNDLRKKGTFHLQIIH